MGIKRRGERGAGSVRCPICRTAVRDRVCTPVCVWIARGLLTRGRSRSLCFAREGVRLMGSLRACGAGDSGVVAVCVESGFGLFRMADVLQVLVSLAAVCWLVLVKWAYNPCWAVNSVPRVDGFLLHFTHAIEPTKPVSGVSGVSGRAITALRSVRGDVITLTSPTPGQYMTCQWSLVFTPHTHQ